MHDAPEPARPPGRGTAWPRNPVVHELNAAAWLTDLGRAEGRPLTLVDVPSHVWDDVARPGIDAVWLMGVWERSPAGAAIARADAAMRGAIDAALPDATDADVIGSAYCIRRYVADERFGGEAGLAAARAALAERGVRLVLDLVPNHVAPDHPWALAHPERFIRGTADDLARDPAGFIEVGGHVLARARDPYFPPWPDVVQLDASRADTRAAMAALVRDLLARCDGLRCDMAMLLLPDVFARTWGERASGSGGDDDPGFWPAVLGPVREAFPDAAIWAEAYWDREPDLIALGFDACYDKRLYERLVAGGERAAPVLDHLAADPSWQERTVRFVENHDEPRAAYALAPDAHRAALAAVLTVPGVALLHEGEADGRHVRVPVTLARRPEEEPDEELGFFVAQLLAAVAGGMRRGAWALARVDGWPDNRSAERLAAWTWTGEAGRHIVVVNLAGLPADGRVRLPWDVRDAGTLVLDDLLTEAEYRHPGRDVAADGLYVALPGHGVHVLRLAAATT